MRSGMAAAPLCLHGHLPPHRGGRWDPHVVGGFLAELHRVGTGHPLEGLQLIAGADRVDLESYVSVASVKGSVCDPNVAGAPPTVLAPRADVEHHLASLVLLHDDTSAVLSNPSGQVNIEAPCRIGKELYRRGGAPCARLRDTSSATPDDDAASPFNRCPRLAQPEPTAQRCMLDEDAPGAAARGNGVEEQVHEHRCTRALLDRSACSRLFNALRFRGGSE